jgi:hypothetical protein
MGHDTQNLVGETGLNQFRGIVLSPVNREPEALALDVPRFRESGQFDIVLDPQLYVPRVERGALGSHPYFPSDLDSADLNSESWWKELATRLLGYAQGLGVDAVASPLMLPKMWRDDYYALSASVADNMAVSSPSIRVLLTSIVSLPELANSDNVLRIASLLSQAAVAGYYLILVSDIEPRRELSDPEELAGAMALIGHLEGTGRPVLVGYCSSEMILWKAAGASNCASGKFFNLRRFTRSRFEEPPSPGGGQLPYWFEHSLMAFLRDADVLRLRKAALGSLLMGGPSNNVWSRAILEQLDQSPEKPWLKLSWRQYLAWFAEAEALFGGENAARAASTHLAAVEDAWLSIEDAKILFDEPRNNGRWVRAWRQALSTIA